MSLRQMAENSTRQILIVDDNGSIRRVISAHLSESGYAVVEAADGISGLRQALSSSADVIVLDVVMPGIDGFKLAHALREKGVTTPIIMLTERTSIDDKVAGFSSGADDYLPKPFNPLELELRIRALLRRSSGQDQRVEASSIERGDLVINLEHHTAYVSGKQLLLTPIEFKILKILASTPGRVYSRRDLLFLIWDTDYDGYKRNIDPHVTRLRTKLEGNPRKPKYVLTVWGVGYKFNETLA